MYTVFSPDLNHVSILIFQLPGRASMACSSPFVHLLRKQDSLRQIAYTTSTEDPEIKSDFPRLSRSAKHLLPFYLPFAWLFQFSFTLTFRAVVRRDLNVEYIALSVGCIPREQSCPGTQTLWGTRALKIYYIMCNLHTIKAFFPSCPPFHLFFFPP